METQVRLHHDGKGVTFLTSYGYTAYRAVAFKRSGRVKVHERHQRRGYSAYVLMTQREWSELMAQAVEA